MANFYEVLGVRPDADAAAIRTAYRTLIRRHHPDANGGEGEARAREINEAYHTLSDPTRRARYDLTLPAPPRAGFRPAPAGSPPPSRPMPRPVRAEGWEGDDPWRREESAGPAAWTVAMIVILVVALGFLGLRTLFAPAHPRRDSLDARAYAGAAGPATAAGREARPLPPRLRKVAQGLDPDERASLEGACLHSGSVYGEEGYRRCEIQQLRELADAGPRPNLAALSPEERGAVEAACMNAKWDLGPAPYDACRRQRMALLASAMDSPLLGRIGRHDRSAIAAYCLGDPAAIDAEGFDRCLAHKVESQ